MRRNGARAGLSRSLQPCHGRAPIQVHRFLVCQLIHHVRCYQLQHYQIVELPVEDWRSMEAAIRSRLRLSYVPLRVTWQTCSMFTSPVKRLSTHSQSTPGNSSPLKDVKVLDLSRVVAVRRPGYELPCANPEIDFAKGPFSAQILSDYGANVIKVEQPGKGVSSRLIWLELSLCVEPSPGRN